MATFSQLQTRVAHIIIDTPASVQAEIPTLINEAIRELQRAHQFKICESSISATTALNTRTLVARPSNFQKWRDFPYLIDDQGQVRGLEWAASRVAAAREYGLTEGGEADADLLNGEPVALVETDPTDELGTANIEVFPLPDDRSLYTDGNYRIVIPYVKYLTPLAATGSQNWFTNNAEDFIAYRAAALGFFQDWDENRGTTWTQLAQSKMREIIKQDKYERISKVRELVPQHNARGSMLGRRDRYPGR